MSDHSDLTNQASVEISGEAIRRIREEKRLTQLYVSKVVGVTTDTVSRWENNRYPTIRKDNATKLAEALEVDLEQILLNRQRPADPDQDSVRSLAGPGGWRTVLLALGIALVLGGSLAAYHYLFRSVTIQVRRILPTFIAPGSQVLIQVHLDSEKPLKMILKEHLPEGWRYLAGHPAASKVDHGHGLVRWIFKNVQSRTNVYYLVQVPDDAKLGETLTLDGELVANHGGSQTMVAITAESPARIARYHWADSNGNDIIDDMEILAVSDLTEETGDELVNWDDLEQLWEAGHYRWDPELRRFVADAAR